MTLPAGTQRLFPDHDPAGLSPELVIPRLLEDGDAADLAWLTATVPEPVLADWLGRHGGRRLSRRSRAFWAVVLGREPGPAAPGAGALWPL